MNIVAQPPPAPVNAGPPGSIRALGALTLVVLLLHLWGLDRLAGWSDPQTPSARPVAWVTRSVRIEAPAPAPVLPPPAVAAAAGTQPSKAVVPRPAASQAKPSAQAQDPPVPARVAPADAAAPETEEKRPVASAESTHNATQSIATVETPVATIGSAAGTPDASTAANAPAAAASAVSAAASGLGTGAARVPAAGVASPSQPVMAGAIASTGGPLGGQELGPIVVPGSTRLRYDVAGLARGREVAARGEMLWLHDGSRYEARLEIGALFLGARVQTSHGQIGANGLEPTRFLDRARREQAVHFERDKGRISFSINSPPAPLLPLSQDRLSVFIQLASMLAGDPARYPVGRTITLPTAGARDVEAWVFQVLGTERQTVLGEEADVVHLARVSRREFEPRLDLWMAPRVAWLPARIRLQQTNGDFIDQRLIAQEAP